MPSTQEGRAMTATHTLPTTTQSDAVHALQSALPDELRHSLCRASEMLRRRRAEFIEEPLPTSLIGLDHLLGGGLPRGNLVEFTGRESCGRFATLLAALRAVTGAGEPAALVDQGEQLDPQVAAEVGVDLERLLWVRPENLRDSLAAAELLIHTGFSLVTLDLGLPPVRGRSSLAAWLRLARSAATHGAVLLVGSPYRLSGCAAAAVVAGGRGRGDWSASGGASHLLDGLKTRLYLARRLGHPGHRNAPSLLTLPDATFTAPTEPSQRSHPTERRKSHVEAL
jgi:hypothetical protein